MNFFLFSLGLIGGIVFLILMIVSAITGRPNKVAFIGLVICIGIFFVGVFWPSSPKAQDAGTNMSKALMMVAEGWDKLS
ncbi:MAG TPA: hypothetical protein GXZ32_07260 [Clostridiales bacterium]|nr:hypothetical protein [Clostridiales bacterium]